MKKIITILFIVFSFVCKAQSALQPGFDGKEYREMLSISARQIDSPRYGYSIPAPNDYNRTFRSSELGLKNRWELWIRNDQKVAVISIRGTIRDQLSWLENFYSAMISANGVLKISDSVRFSYHLAADSAATIHVGWLIGLAFLAPSIIEQTKDCYQKGIKEFIIVGHSQGGALAYLICSYLHYQQEAGNLPADIKWKTYCSAAPKPGNLFYAYDFDFITRNGWAFNVVNTEDWVPETPFSIQTLTDFSKVNPFINVDNALKKQPFFVRLYLKKKFKKLDKATRKAQKRFEQYLGKLAEKQVKKALPQFQPPNYSNSNNYQRAAVPIILKPNERYREQTSGETKNVFIHHSFEAYYYLSKLYYP
jgi:hypothetical protein